MWWPGTAIDGPGNVLGQAGPSRLRPANAGAAAFLPATGDLQFDTADLAAMEADGTLNDVITHEMGHVIGIGTIWTNKKLLKGGHTNNPTFHGANAMREYGALWERVDCLFTPTTPITAPAIGETTAAIGGETEDVRLASTRLVRGLNQIGLKPQGVIAILQAIKAAGALQADLVIQ